MHTEIHQIADEDVIPVDVLRDFVLHSLRHDAIRDVLIERMTFHAERDQLDAVGLAAVLPQLIGDLLALVTSEDWTEIAEELIADLRKALSGEAES